jgi:hypothetical protein
LEDRALLRLLATNNASAAVRASIAIGGWTAAAGASANVTALSAPTLGADNPPGDPAIAPTNALVPLLWTADGEITYTFPPLSVSAVVLRAAAPRGGLAVISQSRTNIYFEV